MHISSNIWKLYIIKGVRYFLIIMPIIVLFFQENGLSMKDVLLLQAAFSVSIFIFEIPSGYFSDIVGRKVSLLIGTIFGFGGFLVYSFATGFWQFLLAEMLIGVGSSFISGTDSALLYDTLVEMKQEQHYTKIEGRFLSIGNFSEGFASILGGLLAEISLRLPFYIETALLLIAIPIAATIIEPKRHKLDNEHNGWTNILKIVKYSLQDNVSVKWLIFYSGVTSASTFTMVWFIQPYLKLVELPLALFGIVWAALQFSVGFFSLSAYKIENIFGRRNSLISLIILSVAGYFLLSLFQSLWAIGFFLIFYFVRGFSTPVLKHYLNELITSDIRATVLSVKSLMMRSIFIVIGPVVGWMSDVYSLQFAFMSAGIIFLISGIISLLFLHKHGLFSRQSISRGTPARCIASQS